MKQNVMAFTGMPDGFKLKMLGDETETRGCRKLRIVKFQTS